MKLTVENLKSCKFNNVAVFKDDNLLFTMENDKDDQPFLLPGENEYWNAEEVADYLTNKYRGSNFEFYDAELIVKPEDIEVDVASQN